MGPRGDSVVQKMLRLIRFWSGVMLGASSSSSEEEGEGEDERGEGGASLSSDAGFEEGRREVAV